MRLNNTTPVPNAFFDKHIGSMSGSAVRVYLKIVRNLLGWRDEFGKVKRRDWISHSQFETQKMRSTKEISLPKYNANERIPDHIRIEQIKQEQERKQLQRDSWL